MLPQEISDTYMLYKGDTNTFATWLCANAMICGYQLPKAATAPAAAPRSSTRAKGKVRKNTASTTPASVKRTVPVNELIAQANAICGTKKPNIKVPRIIQHILTRAIERRKRCSNFFVKMGASENSRANAQHQHFIAVLEQARDLLAPRFEIATAKKTTPSSVTTGPSDDTQKNIGNLDVEDMEDEKVASKALEKAMEPRQTPSGTRPLATTEALEIDQPEDDVDLGFIVFCYLEDLHNLHDFLKSIWQDYKTKTLDLRAAALVTNAACQLVYAKERELLELLPEAEDNTMSDYDIIINVILPNEDGECEVPDEMCSRTYFYENECFNKYQRMLIEGQSADTLPYVSRLDSIYPDAGSLECSHELLSQMLLDLHMKYQGEEKIQDRGGETLPFLDQITKALVEVFDESERSTLPAMFRIRVLLDVNDILEGDAPKAYKSLKRQAALASAAIDIPILSKFYEPVVPSTEGLKSIWGTDTVAQKAKQDAKIIHDVMIENFHIKWKLSVIDHGGFWQGVQRKLGEALNSQILPSEHPCFFQKHNPIYCGMEYLRLTSRMESLGIEMTNNTYSFVVMAHIYNAFSQAGWLLDRWIEMDLALDLYKDDLFRGEYPSNEEAILKRFLLSAGHKATLFASDSRTKVKKSLLSPLEANVPIVEAKPFSKILNEYLHEAGSMTGEKLMYNIYQKQRKNKNREPTRIELLAHLRESTVQALPRMNTDLVTLNKKCSKILLGFREGFQKELGEKHEENGVDKAILNPKWNVETALTMMFEGFGWAMPKGKQTLEGGRTVKTVLGKPAPPNSSFGIALRIFNDLLPELNCTLLVPPVNVVAAARRARGMTSGRNAKLLW